MSASAVINDVRSLLRGQPVFLAGSLVAEETYGKNGAHDDADIFCPNPFVLMTTAQQLLNQGFTLHDRFDRVWARWLKYGMGTWHTNSLKLMSPNAVEFNLVYKLMGKHPVSSLGQVLESFDFGLLATGYDLETDTFRDMRGFLFPHLDPNGPLPLMPEKRDNWRKGFISQYNGLRECGRYAKYHGYGYDMSAVKDDLVTGYFEAAAYMSTTFDDDKKQLGKIYEVIGDHIEMDNIDQLVAAYKTLDFKDSLDEIMEALE